MIRELGVFRTNMSAGCPLIVGDLVFVVTANGGGRKPRETSPLPSAELRRRGQGDRPGEVAECRARPRNIRATASGRNPAYSNAGVPQVIFPGGDGWLYAFDPPTGRLLWKFRTATRKTPSTRSAAAAAEVILSAHRAVCDRPAVHRHRPGPGAHRRASATCGASTWPGRSSLGRINRTATSPRATRNSTQPIL